MNTEAPVPSLTMAPAEPTTVTVEGGEVRIEVGNELDVLIRNAPTEPLGNETAIPVEVTNQPNFWEWGAGDFVSLVSVVATTGLAIWAIVQTHRANRSEQRERDRLQRQELVVIVQEFSRGEGREGDLSEPVLLRYDNRASSISPGAAQVWRWIAWQFRTLQTTIEEEHRRRHEDAEERPAHTANAWVGDYIGLEEAVWARVWAWVKSGQFDEAMIPWVEKAAEKQGVHLEFAPASQEVDSEQPPRLRWLRERVCPGESTKPVSKERKASGGTDEGA